MNGSQKRLSFDLLDSTNAEALRLAEAGERGPIWIDADQQSLGRGRSGREWLSGPGNLMTSYLFSPKGSATTIYQLSLVAGVAVIKTLHRCAAPGSAQLRLKWPNDVMLGSAKAGGILIESSKFAGETVAVIGIGLNVAAAPRIEGVATANLQDVLTKDGDLPTLRAVLSQQMETWLETWAEGSGFAGIRQAWCAHGPELGDALSIKAGEDVHHGQYAGLDEHGSLRLKSGDGAVQCYTFGDVSLSTG